MKSRIAYRPVVESLENRLQPGSMIPMQGYGWSLADGLSLLNPESWDSQSASSAGSSKPTPTSTLAAEHHDALEIAAARAASALSGPSSLPANNLVDNLAADLTNDDLGDLRLRGQQVPIPLAAVATSRIVPPSAVVSASSSPQSPTGVAAPAAATAPTAVKGPPAASVQSATGHTAVPAQFVSVDSGTVLSSAGHQITNEIRAIPLLLANRSNHRGGSAGNQATLNFLSYLGGSGPDSINNIAVRKENGANFIYLAGSLTDGSGRTNGFAAKLTDGASSVVWAMTLAFPTPGPGPDQVTGLALNDKSVYLAGAVADLTASAQTDGFVAQLDAATGAMVSSAALLNTSLAAVTTDPAGNVYAAGSSPDPNNLHQQDVYLVKETGGLTTSIYNAPIRFVQNLTGALANSAVTSGGGLVVDGQGDVYFAGGVGLIGEPNNDIVPLVGWFNDASLPTLYASINFPNLYPGPRGMGTAVALDPAGNLVFTGSLNDNGGTQLNQDLLLGRALPTLVSVPDDQGNLLFVPGFAVVDALRWYVDDRTPAHNRVGDWTSNGLVVLADGSTIVTGAAYDPAAPNSPPLSLPSKGIDVHLTHFTPTDDNTVNTQNSDGDPENIFGGSGTDMGTAVALDPTKPANVYVVGSTTSTDLPTSSGVLQPTYRGGSTTGFIGQASVQ